ncbi:HAD hydrolase family protein [Candidatus Igneacidithiobacillus taiwanensis]|uniref:KdsC family phosphatase n=1 Tax=Candidatus Igneacidithiobacillus taiwanensis TaxID=1945924 RepID=UPI00289C9E70|nr:HAD hydrolase family protein [Candidatus Igneacidithiobacillus taiwanensis]MCE5359850.1 HAD hydrolase family protein [Acidithiobacillus sp.]
MSDLIRRCQGLRMLVLDVDGVLTDGRLLFDATGQESKIFHVRDGHGIRLLQDCGVEVALITARFSPALAHRARDLGISRVYQGSLDKVVAYTELLLATGYDDAELAYMGDDLIDLAVLRRVGLAAAPADAHPEVLTRVHWVAQNNGGMGAVRELSEFILRAQGKWDGVLARALGTV